MTKEVYTAIMKNTGGVIINVSSTIQLPCVYMEMHASAGKSAVDSLTRSLALELGPKNIRVNGIAPGYIGNTESFHRLAPKNADDPSDRIPLQRYGGTREIAEGILYLISAKYVTGHTLLVDGGAVLSFPNLSLVPKSLFNLWKAKL